MDGGSGSGSGIFKAKVSSTIIYPKEFITRKHNKSKETGNVRVVNDRRKIYCSCFSSFCMEITNAKPKRNSLTESASPQSPMSVNI